MFQFEYATATEHYGLVLFRYHYGIISENPQVLDINSPSFSGEGQGDDANDWTHCNSIHYNLILDQIVLSSRHRNELYIIDHSTTSFEASSSEGGIYGKGGDFLYRWGNPQNYNRGSNNSQILNGQHGVNWIPENCPGSGNIIIFNNIHNNVNNSAVLEIVPPINDNGTYQIDGINPYDPTSYNWIYQNDFFSLTRSGAFRLPNGNTIITSFGDEIFEIDSLNQVMWTYNGELIPSRVLKYPYNYLDVLLGDINNDSMLDILDIVITVNFILSNEYNELADLNSDGNMDILDVVQLVNIILN